MSRQVHTRAGKCMGYMVGSKLYACGTKSQGVSDGGDCRRCTRELSSNEIANQRLRNQRISNPLNGPLVHERRYDA